MNNINYRQVLEIETCLTDIFEQNTSIERFLWRHPSSINTSLRVDKSRRYTFEDLYIYLTSKYPDDVMIKKGKEEIIQLFLLCASGERLCEIDKELLEINENQEFYVISTEVLKINILNTATEYTGSTSFFLFCLKNIIDQNKSLYINQNMTRDLKDKILYSFFGFLNLIGEFNPEKFGINAIKCTPTIPYSSFISTRFQKLKDYTNEFMTYPTFTSYEKSCKKNNYNPPYTSDDKEVFLNDLLVFSITILR